MSVIIWKNAPIHELFPNLSAEEINRLEQIIHLMDENIFTPIIEAEDKETEFEKRFPYYFIYCVQIIYQSIPKILELCSSSESLSKIEKLLRKKLEVLDDFSRSTAINLFNILWEHQRYMSRLLSEGLDKSSRFLIENFENEHEIYINVLYKTSLALNVILAAIDRKPEAIRKLSRIAYKYADELESFVGTLQVLLEPDLANLKKKATEHDFEKAKPLV